MYRCTAQHCAYRLVTRPQPFCDRTDVWRGIILFRGKKRARATHAAHNFVKDQQDTVPVAQSAGPLKVIPDWRDGPKRRADDRFRDKSHDGARTNCRDLCLKFFDQTVHILCIRFVISLTAIGVTG